MVLMMLALIWLGVYPQPVLDAASSTLAGLSVGGP